MAKKSLNKNLHKASKAKEDEFYTQLPDIERELKYYKKHFKGKVVYCNCDDPRISNFFHYFSYNFEKLGLKKLITTCYKNQSMDLFSKHDTEQAIYLEYNGDKNNNRIPDPDEIGIVPLKGNGDFRSKESIELLKQANIVVTNPPFSLFREYVNQLVEYDKKFLVIGNINAISYKECFELIKSDKMWLGYNTVRHFGRPDGSMYETARSFWYTNLDIAKRHEDIILYKSYNETPDAYPTYENFDAINVDRTYDIPMDYNGFMGVPITFLDKYNPAQFEIIGLGISNSGLEIGVQPYKPEHKKYRKEIQKRGAVDGDLYMMKDGEVSVPYARVIIKNKRI
ncbi:adenine-specific methyltransferase EcoRI family protein [Algoriphagus marincola]|uniref:Adenine-specific methyltransferase EcoRI family protein n=1 Tax=Algoriphagus marincola TaxID=264027 RepID=A0ABS7N2T2_9BACT|nr:adenine-specific methyltransferase EcoRI family protein [Algoriphagus marincola]MBY5950644.1 adenine-specific methyltransferase EcoRI family protein [Algoriphagus marincola]